MGVMTPAERKLGRDRGDDLSRDDSRALEGSGEASRRTLSAYVAPDPGPGAGDSAQELDAGLRSTFQCGPKGLLMNRRTRVVAGHRLR